MTAKELQRARTRAELESAGVDIERLPGGALRLRGAFGNVILVHDLATLTASEIKRLTAWGG
jgi:hypothetical protein